MTVKKKPEAKEPVKKSTGLFLNNTKRNVFTTAGRCMAGETVTLPIAEGESTKGLVSA